MTTDFVADVATMLLAELDGVIELAPHQQPPTDLSHGWLLLGGRGAGKTFASMRYLSEQAHKVDGLRARIIAPTLDDAVNSCVIDPDSGLYSFDSDAKLTAGLGGTRVVWPNGSTCWLIGTPTLRDVDRLRALTNIELDIFEEAAANPMLARAVEQANFSRRRDHARWVATTTPRPIAQIKAWLADQRVTSVRASSFDNPNLPAAYRDTLADIEGTRLYRQEALAEMLLDAEGARWAYDWLDASRVYELPSEVDKYVVAVDPASGSGTTGIVAACRSNGHLYVTDDMSVTDGTPEQWASAAVRLAEERNATIVAEDNQGGRMVESTIKNTGTNIRVDLRRAKVSKELRADPIALLWEKEPPTGHIVGSMPKLEDQLVTWEPYVNGRKNPDSPDRLDAMVWACTELRVPDTGSVSINPAVAGVTSVSSPSLTSFRRGR
jgi:phage terminase large subunit-like protein